MEPTTQTETAWLRVLCPDGEIAELVTAVMPDAETIAREYADHYDRVHDVCNDRHPGEAHRIERATWTEVTR